ncbi:hypothetical protein ABW20_dc0107693 [Dactylellina cionopaga]|nr:hypothetical protein ABW20_dc0107693 [Dactylellina cionopaga]
MASLQRAHIRPKVASQVRPSTIASLKPRPATPNRNHLSGQSLLQGKDAIIAFAIKAVVALHEEFDYLRKQFGHNTFLTWPTFVEPKNCYDQSSYRRLFLIINGQPEHARACIKRLAENRSNGASKDRQKFVNTFKAFANVKRESLGPELSDLVISGTKLALNDDTSQCLQKLYSTLCQLCRCPVAVNNSNFKANIAPDVTAPSAGADDSVAVDLFFLHRHIGNSETDEWKEARIRVFLERYASSSTWNVAINS